MLSVIIPIHNSEKYLRQCIESVINQIYKNIEIVLVENNSSDKSRIICEEYAACYSNIKLCYETKVGAAAARNHGISVASGEYITFVDSDDFLQPDAYKIVMDQIEEEDVDLACFSFEYIDENENRLGWYSPKLSKYIKKQELNGVDIARIFLTSRDIEGFGWNKIFKRSIFIDNQIRFDEKKRAYEDMAILFEAICCCTKAILIPEKIYFYRQLSGSLSHDNYELKQDEYIDSVNQIIWKAKQVNLNKEAKVFAASRNIYSLYDMCKMNSLKKIPALRLDMLQAAWLMLKYYRSEKIKMVSKAVWILCNYCEHND